MLEIGESSQVREEEPRDLHVVYEELVVEESEEDHEADLEEVDELGGFSDGTPEVEATAEEEMIAGAIDTINGLEIRVLELEEQAVERQETLEQKETAVQVLTTQKLELETKVVQLENKVLQVETEKEIIKEQLKEERVERERMEDAWVKAARRVDIVEQEVRAKKVRIDDMKYAFRTAVGRTQDRIYHYPVEYGQYWNTVNRGVVMDIIDQEYDDAVRRGMSPWNYW